MMTEEELIKSLSQVINVYALYDQEVLYSFKQFGITFDSRTKILKYLDKAVLIPVNEYNGKNVVSGLHIIECFCELLGIKEIDEIVDMSCLLYQEEKIK